MDAYQERQREWPDEALATFPVSGKRCQLHPAHAGRDKSDPALLLSYYKSSSDSSGELFVLARPINFRAGVCKGF